MKIALALTLCALAALAGASNRTGSPEFQHPVIKNHGGIVPLPDAVQQPKKDSKVLLDITSDEKTGKVIKGFDRAALILNQYTAAGAGVDHGFQMALILHGPATKAALKNEAYAMHLNPYARSQGATSNPDLELIRQLKEAGVEIYVCGQAMAHHGFSADEIAPEVTIAVSAATVNINLQMDGYAYIPFF